MRVLHLLKCLILFNLPLGQGVGLNRNPLCTFCSPALKLLKSKISINLCTFAPAPFIFISTTENRGNFFLVSVPLKGVCWPPLEFFRKQIHPQFWRQLWLVVLPQLQQPPPWSPRILTFFYRFGLESKKIERVAFEMLQMKEQDNYV